MTGMEVSLVASLLEALETRGGNNRSRVLDAVRDTLAQAMARRRGRTVETAARHMHSFLMQSAPLLDHAEWKRTAFDPFVQQLRLDVHRLENPVVGGSPLPPARSVWHVPPVNPWAATVYTVCSVILVTALVVTTRISGL